MLIVSCSTTNTLENNTYFGGEIVNPKAKFVLFLKNDKVQDTLFLDKNNRFMGVFPNLEEGLYSFTHDVEFQNIYLEPKDSLLVRLNTWDFDESLVFSGKGSGKNEFLINVYLQNEKDESRVKRFFNLNESDFEGKINALVKKRALYYERFAESEEFVSPEFTKVANTSMYYPLYRMKEVYPLYHRMGLRLDQFPSLSKEFYNYRNDINLNDESLMTYHPYRNYVINYMFHLGYLVKENDKTKSNITSNILNEISDKIELEEFRNDLLKTIIVSDFLKSESSCTVNEPALNIFLENCTNEDYISYVKNLVNDSQFVVSNKPLENFEVESLRNGETAIVDVIDNQNTVIYFWSTEFMAPDYLVKRIKYLERKYPEVLFVGINIQENAEEIYNHPSFKRLDANNQFKLPEDSHAHNYLKSKSPRTIIVNSNGNVVNGFIYLDSKKLPEELNKIQKK